MIDGEEYYSKVLSKFKEDTLNRLEGISKNFESNVQKMIDYLDTYVVQEDIFKRIDKYISKCDSKQDIKEIESITKEMYDTFWD